MKITKKATDTLEGQLIQRNLPIPILEENVREWINQLEFFSKIAAVESQAVYFAFVGGFKQSYIRN